MQERPAQHVNQEEWRRYRDEARKNLRQGTPLEIPVGDDNGFLTYMVLSDMDFDFGHDAGHHHTIDHNGSFDLGHTAVDGVEGLVALGVVILTVQAIGCTVGVLVNAISREIQIRQKARDYADMMTGRKPIPMDSRRGRRLVRQIQNPQ